jgi:hypothetical protein
MLWRLFLYLSRKQRIDRLFVPVRPRHVLRRRGERLRKLRARNLPTIDRSDGVFGLLRRNDVPSRADRLHQLCGGHIPGYLWV